MALVRTIVILLLITLGSVYSQDSILNVRHYSVTVSADVSTTLFSNIKLNWLSDSAAITYTISRKTQNSGWTELATVNGNATSFSDQTIEIGQIYEYQIAKRAHVNNKDVSGYGYIASGIEVNPDETQGKLLLLIDDVNAAKLGKLVDTFIRTLTGDGWTVITKKVSRAEQFSREKVKEVKDIIQKEYTTDSSLAAILLLGRIAVPYSGHFAPDNHPDHVGAWASDCYYGDVTPSLIDARWSDLYVSDSESTRQENWNRRLDGKFDQSTIVSDIDIAVGRVDFYNLPEVSESEEQLLSDYLHRNIDYRTKKIIPEYKAIIDDNFGVYGGEAFAQAGWSNFGGLVGNLFVKDGKILSIPTSKPYVWSYGCGPSDYTSISGVGNTKEFSTRSVKSIFMMLFGSYCGDWDSENNVLRAALASKPSALATMWSGRPIWRVHPMGMGATLGSCTLLSQNNDGSIYVSNSYSRGTHIALMGDPTLKMNVIAMPRNLHLTESGNLASLTWDAPIEPVIGYYIYRKEIDGNYIRIGSTSETWWTDSTAIVGVEYMVRALDLVKSPSGSYYSLSSGIFSNGIPVGIQGANIQNRTTVDVTPNPAQNNVLITLNLPSQSNCRIEIVSSFGGIIHKEEIISQSDHISWQWDCSDKYNQLVPPGVYHVKITNGKDCYYQKIVVIH
ncbi:MAG: T9SS type A sorting domain-containing protein [Bacteroidetes bacterium]|nr:T9SS type A sorting domain-containing protein [Bacteroidota bacterium]